MKQSVHQLNNDTGAVDDLELGIETIKRRSEGLLKFAETYRNLNKITTLNLKKVYVSDLFENLHHLMQPTLEQKNIELEIILKDTDLMLEADTNLLEQVLINLVVNAIEAVKETPEPRIILSAYVANNKKTVVKVTDNGNGMTEEVLDKIFILFSAPKNWQRYWPQPLQTNYDAAQRKHTGAKHRRGGDVVPAAILRTTGRHRRSDRLIRFNQFQLWKQKQILLSWQRRSNLRNCELMNDAQCRICSGLLVEALLVV